MRQATLNRLLFPGPTKEFLATRETYGNVGRLDTLDFLYGLQPGQEHVARIGRGVSLILGLSAIGNADERGMRTVMCTINGQLRPIRVRDNSIKVDVKAAERADPNKPGHVAAPFAGVVTVTVAEGDEVEAGATVATIEAMKMEAAITAPVAGIVQRLALGSMSAGRRRRPGPGDHAYLVRAELVDMCPEPVEGGGICALSLMKTCALSLSKGTFRLFD